MSKKKLLIIFGTRPEIIKLAPLIIGLREEENFITTICNTEQQKELSKQTLSFFELKSDVDLDVMQPNQTLPGLQAKILNKIQSEFDKEKYDGVIVQGDTMTAFCGALAAFYNKIPLFYVEAGLRSNDLFEPFPEEGLRQMITRLADLNFAPTDISYNNIISEGIGLSKVKLTGNTVVDALYCLSEETTKKALNFIEENKININDDFVLITCHRRENHGERLDNIIKAIKMLSDEFKNIKFIIPIHPNPNVKGKIKNAFSSSSNVLLLNPLDYPVLVELEKYAKLILTDSGGIQEEAPTFGTPLIVMRYETERPEGVEAGFAQLLGADTERIYNASKEILLKKDSKIKNKKNPYGDGQACKKIIQSIKEYMEFLHK